MIVKTKQKIGNANISKKQNLLLLVTIRFIYELKEKLQCTK